MTFWRNIRYTKYIYAEKVRKIKYEILIMSKKYFSQHKMKSETKSFNSNFVSSTWPKRKILNFSAEIAQN